MFSHIIQLRKHLFSFKDKWWKNKYTLQSNIFAKTKNRRQHLGGKLWELYKYKSKPWEQNCRKLQIFGYFLKSTSRKTALDFVRPDDFWRKKLFWPNRVTKKYKSKILLYFLPRKEYFSSHFILKITKIGPPYGTGASNQSVNFCQMIWCENNVAWPGNACKSFRQRPKNPRLLRR